ncbi:MAG: T9SS C-terminal target domain-containing protein [Calditrichaeota bacterium]|nr:MAG: T9SS C-terminal target domain-containing protein [Calditrichota bacterium]
MAIEEVVHDLGYTTVVHIRYGAWTSDNYYQNNPTDNIGRINYYGQGTSTPQAWVDGVHHMLGSGQIASQVRGYVESRSQLDSPYHIKISANHVDHTVTVTVIATGSPPSFGDKYLRIAMIEKAYDWPTPPGTNQQTHFEHCLLDMVPDAQGTLVNLAQGDSMTVTFNYNVNQVNFHPPQLEALLCVVAFVQNDMNKEVLQAAFHEIGVNTGKTISGALIESNNTATLSGYAVNTCPADVDVDLSISGTIPSGWIVTASGENGENIPVNGGTATVTISPQDTFHYDILVDPQGNGGATFLYANTALTSNPAVSHEEAFTVTTKDVDVIVVDDDGGETYESYILNELSQMTYSYGLVSINSGDLAPNDLIGIPVVIWNCGTASPTLTQEDRDALAAYLDNGGRLYLNGLDIAYELADSTSPYFSTSSLAFYTDYLHAGYVRRDYNSVAVEGINGDEITNGIGIVGLTDGTGAGTIDPSSDRYANRIEPGDANATPIFHYFMFNHRYPAIKAIHNNTGRVVFTTFGFETIAEASNRALIAQRIVDWLYPTVGVEAPGDPVAPFTFALKPNYPNPFNPSTHIQYTLPAGKGKLRAVLTVFNTLGQKVITLVDAPQSAGNYEVQWDGRDEAGNLAPSGVYFYQLRYGELQATQKMILLR